MVKIKETNPATEKKKKKIQSQSYDVTPLVISSFTVIP